MSASRGTMGQLGIDTVSPVAQRFQYISEDLVNNEEKIDAGGIVGSRDYDIARVRGGPQKIAGPIIFQPTAVELAALLPWILCGTTSGTPVVSYFLGNDSAERHVAIDRVGKVFNFVGVGVDVATLTCNQGEALRLTTNCVAKTESVANAGTFPAIDFDSDTGPFILSDLVMTVNAVTVTPKNLTLTINNMIDKERFFNSNTLSDIVMLDRIVTFSTLLPYGAHEALYGAGGDAGVQVIATFTNGAAELVITLPKVVLPKRGPNTPGRVEIMLPLEGKAYRNYVTPTATILCTLNTGV